MFKLGKLVVFLLVMLVTNAIAQPHTLIKGWNLEGNDTGTAVYPNALFGNATNATLLSTSINTVWVWDKNAAQWYFFTPSMTPNELSLYANSKGYGVLATIPPGQGFWVNAYLDVPVDLAAPSSSSCGATLPVTHINASIAVQTTWLKCNVYALDKTIYVDSTLTIQAGAIIKFAAGSGIIVSSTGTIIANGTPADNIVFTSIKDDNSGGDSNNDGTTLPQAGDWGNIALNSSGSTFNYVRFLYGGYADSTLQIGGSFVNSATITNSTFAHNNGGNVSDSWGPIGALDASAAKAGTVIAGNTFYDNKVPISISGEFSMDDSNTFHDPATPSVKNTYNGIFHMGHSSKPIMGLISYAETEVPFVLAGYIDVPAGSALTLGDNVVVKFMSKSDSLSSSGGTIIANATNRIVFTSFKDDVHGGDTNGDGTLSVPQVGDWHGIQISANGSLFNKIELYYSGSTSGTGTAGLGIVNSNTSITNSIFAHNDGGNLGNPPFVNGVLNTYLATAGTIITGNTFFDNNVPLTISGRFDLDDSNVFHDPANVTVRNTYNAVFFYGNSSNSFDTITLSTTEVPFALAGSLSIPSGMTLTLGNNVAFKFYGTQGTLWFTGSVLNSNGPGVVFTSIKDDSVKGDTNGDGTASSPSASDWYGIKDSKGSYTTLSNEFYHLY
jgi:hypothetical protein